MKRITLSIFLLVAGLGLSAQTPLPRLFLDLPSIYLAAPNAEKIQNLAGVGVETAMNLGTHWSTVRLGGGAVLTVDPKSDDIGNSFVTTPYALFEVGLGKYRTNGNQCVRTRASAFTAMAKGGLRYNFETRDLVPADDIRAMELDYTVGAELGYFYIRDVFKNTEVFLNGNYYVKAKVVSAEFGFKMFLNLRGRR